MARIDLEGDYSDPYKNFTGGSSSFDEKAGARQPAQEISLPPGRSPWDEQFPTPQQPGSNPIPADWPTKFTQQMRPDPSDDRPPQPNQNPPLPSASGGSNNINDIEKQLQQRLGGLYDPSILGDVVRNTSYANNSDTLQGWIDRVVNKNLLRGSNEANSTYTPNGQGGYTTGPTGKINGDPRAATSRPPGTSEQGPSWGQGAPYTGQYGGGPSYSPQGVNYPGFQFSDPYTNLLEQIAKNQIQSLTGQNHQTQQLMDYINKQFGNLSNAQGYTPDELAVLRTQAFEPLEAMRHASQQRELERTSRAGYLPTSGITLDQQRQIDTDTDKARTAMGRDLAINSINRQDQQRAQALQLGQMGMQIPQQQNAQALDVANVLYQLPRQAMMDANTIVNGSAPQNVLSPYIQLMQQQQQAQLVAQQQQQQFWDSIGANLQRLFGG